jgi:hypothetical protein
LLFCTQALILEVEVILITCRPEHLQLLGQLLLQLALLLDLGAQLFNLVPSLIAEAPLPMELCHGVLSLHHQAIIVMSKVLQLAL